MLTYMTIISLLLRFFTHTHTHTHTHTLTYNINKLHNYYVTLKFFVRTFILYNKSVYKNLIFIFSLVSCYEISHKLYKEIFISY